MEKPKFLLLEINNNFSAVCNICGRYLFRFSAKIQNSETNETLICGSECVKKFTGETFERIKSTTELYNVFLIEDEERERAKLFLSHKRKVFTEANKEIVEWIELRIAQEDRIFDDAIKSFLKNSLSGEYPYYRGEFWLSLQKQIAEKGTLTEKQINFVKEDMSRNREIEYKKGEKVRVSGKITKILGREGYGRQINYTLKMRTEDNVDVLLPLSLNLKEELDIQTNIEHDRYGNILKVHITKSPERIALEGTVSWADPAGGKIKIIRCKKK